MKQTLKRLPLAIAVLSAFGAAHSATAQDEPAVTLETMNVAVDRQGAKSKTNVVTTAIKNKRTETDLRGLLSEEPAINFGGGNGNSQWWTIRGMGQDHIDVKVDNAYSDAQMFHHQGRFMLDPALVKIVSVQKGAGSASAGIGATSGAIVAKTLDAKELLANSRNENFGFKLNAGYNSNEGSNYGAAVFGKAGKVDALVAGNWVNNEDYEDGNGAVVNNSALDQRGLLAKVGLDVNEDNRFVASYRQEYTEGMRNLREEFIDFAGNTPRYRETKQETTMLEYTGKNLGFVDKVEANIYEMDITRKEKDPTTNVMGQEAEIKTTGGNVNFDTWASKDTLLKYGVNYRKEEANPAGQPVNQEKTDVGVYAEAIGYINDFTVTGGLRYDHFDYTATNGSSAKHGDINPSLGIIYQATPALSFSANHNYATRSPRLYETVISGSNNIRVTDDLKAEKARNTEVGFNYNNGNFSADGSYFWQKIDDAIGLTGCEGRQQGRNCLGTRRLYNSGKIENEGYELGLGYRFDDALKGLSARIGVAYQEPVVYGTVVDNNQTAIWQGRTWTGSLAYQFQNYPVELGWRGRVVEDGEGYASRGSDGTVNASNLQKRDGYNVHDFYINWKPYRNDSMNVNLSVNNAFDEYYKSHSERVGNNSLAGTGRDVRVGVNFTY